MKKGCILFDSTDIFGNRIGGAEIFLKGMIKYAPESFDISVVGTTIDKIERPLRRWSRLSFCGRNINYLPVLLELDENYKSAIPLSLRYTLALSREKINTRNKALFFNRIEPSIVYKKKCAKIVMVHNDVVSQIMRGNQSEMLWSKVPFLYKLFEKYALRRIDHLYTVSENSVGYYHSNYPDLKTRISFLPTWFDPDVFSPSETGKPQIRSRIIPFQYQSQINARWILFVGRLQEQKAPLRLIEVFNKYYEVDRNSMLLIVGDGNLRGKMLEKVERYGLVEKVFHIKHLPQFQLVDFYRAADALLLTSNYEGMPISVLEALGCGLPVVSTRVGEVSRVVKNGSSGEVIDSLDAAKIAEGLKKVLLTPSAYSRANCLSAVKDFIPGKVLEPLFNKMANLCELKAQS